MYESHGWGTVYPQVPGTTIESSVKIFHPEKVKIHEGCYIGHGTIIKGYPFAYHSIEIGPGTWIGENVYLNGAGGIQILSTLEEPVGIGPGVYILTSYHDISGPHRAVMKNNIVFDGITIKSGADIGMSSKILPGVHIGRGAMIGAGSVVTKPVPDFEIWAGVPAKKIGVRSFSLPHEKDHP